MVGKPPLKVVKYPKAKLCPTFALLQGKARVKLGDCPTPSASLCQNFVPGGVGQLEVVPPMMRSQKDLLRLNMFVIL